jgi:molecular chaperone GrpE
MEENNKTATEPGEMDINADSDLPGNTHLSNDPGSGNASVSLAEELEEQKDKYIRLMAEFDNFKRRNARERIELMNTAGKDIIVSLLEVLDDMDRAEKQMENSEEAGKIKEGNRLVFNKLRHVLQQKGLTAMVSMGTPFDPDKHEAITQLETPDKKGEVIDELEKGYYLNDRLIRVATVVVGK